MFDFVPAEFRPFIGVAVLAALFVSVAGMIQKYRAWQAEKMAKAQSLLRGAGLLRRSVARLEGLPLPKEVAELCRDEQIQRYEGVKALFSNYEGIEDLSAEARRLGPVAPGDKAWLPPLLDTPAQFEAYTTALSGILEFLSTERCVSGLSAAAAKDLRVRLRTLRAEAQYAHFRQVSVELAQRKEWDKAVKETLKLLALIKEKAAPNARGKELYHEVLALYRLLAHKELPADAQVE